MTTTKATNPRQPKPPLSLYQLLDPDVLANPYPLYHRLRREDPVHRIEGPTFKPFWAVTRHADIFEVERQHDRFWNTKESVFDPSGGFMDEIRAAHECMARDEHIGKLVIEMP